MGQNAASPIAGAGSNKPVEIREATGFPVTADQRALTLAVSSAVKQLNDAGYAGTGREVTFSVDRGTREPVVKVIDSETRQVIEQWPPKYLLEIAAENINQ